MESKIEDLIADHRKELEEMCQRVKGLKLHSFFGDDGDNDEIADKGEMIANIMLAYRHLEDARMRLGMVYKAKDGGKSCYDK